LSRNITRVVIKNKAEKLRFALVGAVNTLIDFSVLFTLSFFGIPVILANIASTSAAFCFSFFANKTYTFKTTSGTTKRQLLLFVIITLFGLWVIQNIVIAIVRPLLDLTSLPDGAVLFTAKVLATITSLTWNYTLYSRVVFKKEK
jgi:putative flippase GtrA